MKHTDAIISECGKYRYYLSRKISNINTNLLLFIMLNPSTADASEDDNTIRRCRGFCERLGYGLLGVVNLFDYRATNQDELKKVTVPCSEKNMEYIKGAVIKADKIICAWGGKIPVKGQDKKIIDILRQEDITPYALGLTKEGFPKHPLYLSNETRPVIFQI